MNENKQNDTYRLIHTGIDSVMKIDLELLWLIPKFDNIKL